MRQRGDLGSIFFLILVIGGAVYLFLRWGDTSVKSGRSIEAAREWSGKIEKTGKEMDTVVSVLRYIPPVSLGTMMADLVSGYPAWFFAKARASYDTAKSGVASLHYHAMQCADIEQQLAQAKADKRLQAYRKSILKRLGEARKSYDQAAGGISQSLRSTCSNLRRAALVSTGATMLLILFATGAVSLAIAVMPCLRKDKDGALELQIRDKDMATTVRLRISDPESLPLYRLLEEKRLLSGMTRALLAILAAYPEHPASIEGHSPASLGLLQHTEKTLRRVLENLPEGLDAIAAATSALAHDIGKILAYQKGDDGQWFTTGLYHDRLSATILASLPEFHQEFTGDLKTAVLAAVRYHHAPLDMPVNVPELSRQLAGLLKEKDSDAAREEKREAVESIAPYVYSAFRKTVTELNVNGHNGGPPHGFTLNGAQGQTALVYEHALREHIIANLPVRLKEQVSGERVQGKVHATWPVIAGVLTEKNVILRRIDEIDADANGFFDLEITMPDAEPGTHSCLVALNHEVIPESTWMRWTSFPAPSIKVKRSVCA